MQAERELGWNQGWQDFVIGLALSFAFVEAIAAGILIWANKSTSPPVTPAPTTQLLLFVKILSLALPFVLIYGMYLAAWAWVHRAQTEMQASGSTGGVIYRKLVTSPYRLGSVMIFGSTIVGVILSNLIGRNAVNDRTVLAGALLRMAIGIACAWLAVYVRRDIEALMTGAGIDNPSMETERDRTAGKPKTSIAPLIAVGVTVLLWASAFVAIREVGHALSPGALSLGRLLVGSAVLGAVVLIRGNRDPRPDSAHAWPVGKAWIWLLACGVLWFGVYNVALNAAEQRIDAGTAAMLVNIGPILIAILSGLTLGERFSSTFVIGAAIAFVGVVVIGVATSDHKSTNVLGVVLCLVAAVAYAVGVVAQKPVLAEVSALRVTWLACTIGAVVCLPFAGQLVHDIRHAGASAIWLVIYLGALPTALAFTTWAYALARTSAGRLGVTTYLVPPIAILMGWAFLGEAPVAFAYVGGALCLAGVAVARRPAPKPVPSDANA